MRRTVVYIGFNKGADFVSFALGSFWIFIFSLLISVLFIYFNWTFASNNAWFSLSNTLQLITWFALLIIQLTQNRDTKAMNVKLDALLIALEKAPNELVQVEKKDLKRVKEFQDKVASSMGEDLNTSGIFGEM